jgi:hypothetical protein
LEDLEPPQDKYHKLLDFVHENELILEGKEAEAAQLVQRSLGCFTRNNPVRKLSIQVINSKIFDRFILLTIAATSVMMGLTDYANFDRETGEILNEGSLRNELIASTEGWFLFIFTIECTLKVIALGFCWGNNTYLKDPWNWIDFTVVVSGVLEIIPNVPNVGFLRMMRLLRPLRSLDALGLKGVITTLLVSIPALGTVGALLVLLFFIYGILGVQMWGVPGAMHGRCRLTPFPILLETSGAPALPSFAHRADLEVFYTGLTQQGFVDLAGSQRQQNGSMTNGTRAGLNMTQHAYAQRCVMQPNNMDAWREDPSTSPWAEPQQCWWPIDADDDRLCSVVSGISFSSGHECGAQRWCGSNYDELGRDRFVDPRVMSGDLFALNGFGFTTFDQLGDAFFTIFQCITLEGWTPIMYSVDDSGNTTSGGIYFVSLFIFGGLFLLNLVLAVVYNSFEKQNRVLQEAEYNEQIKTMFGGEELGDGIITAREVFEAKGGLPRDARREIVRLLKESHENMVTLGQLQKLLMAHRDDKAGSWLKESGAQRKKRQREELWEDRTYAETKRWENETDHWVLLRHKMLKGCCRAPVVCVEWVWGKYVWCCWHSPCGICTPFAVIAKSSWFEKLVIVMIASNSFVLALDRYPISEEEVDILALFNALFTLFFFGEMWLKLIGLGPLVYLSDSFNRFDVLIVIGSVWEISSSPPAMLGGTAGESGGGVSALRCFRVFRLLKLLKEVESLRRLLVTVLSVLADVMTFGVLLVIFIYIFALAGMQILANRFRFDPWTRRLVSFNDENYDSSASPRANFDTLREALLSVVQILTGEDWPSIWYDARLAQGLAGTAYIVIVVSVANFVVLNLFVAMLIGGFEEKLLFEEQETVP